MSTQMSFFGPTRRHDGVTLRSFHVRKPIPGPAAEVAAEVKRGERKARQQEGAILAFYRANPGAWSPSQVWLEAQGPQRWLITSVRRAITGLTKAGYLRLTVERRMSPWGAMEHLWTLADRSIR